MTLWLARHARCPQGEGLCYGALDLAADPAATQAAAQALAPQLPASVLVRCSPLRRCEQLAQALATLRPECVPQADPRLREMDFGTWEGRPWDAVARAEIDAWTADFAAYRCGGGECVADFMRRVAAAWQEARAAACDVLWITHAGVERAVRLLLQGVPVPRAAADWPRTGLAPGAFTAIDLHRGGVAESSSGKS